MKRIRWLFLLSTIGVGGLVFVSGCGNGKDGQGGQGLAKPTLGANTAFQTNGSTDDGDDANGNATRYPPTRTSSDNLTTATSTPTTYRDLAVDVHAEPGANPTRTAIAFGNTKATSTFTVATRTTCRLFVSSEATATLDSGLADYLVVARVRSAPATPGQAGPPVSGSDTQVRYAFSQTPTNPATLDIQRSGLANGTVANGGTAQQADSSATFTLPPGTYTLEFEITANGTADTRADLRAKAEVDLR